MCIRKKHKDGTISTIFQFTNRCGVDLVWSGPPFHVWTLTFYDDGDPVVIEHVPRWQLEHLKDMIDYELRRKKGPDDFSSDDDG